MLSPDDNSNGSALSANLVTPISTPTNGTGEGANAVDQTAPSQPAPQNAPTQQQNSAPQNSAPQNSAPQNSASVGDQGTADLEARREQNYTPLTPQALPKTGLFHALTAGLFNSLKGAGEGLLMEGVPGAVVGAVAPKFIQNQFANQKQMAQNQADLSNSAVQFANERAAKAVVDTMAANQAYHQAGTEFQEQQDDHALNLWQRFHQMGIDPAAVTGDDPAAAHAQLQNMTTQDGAVPHLFNLHLGGNLVSYNVDQLSQSTVPPPVVEEWRSFQGLGKQDQQQWASMSPDARASVVDNSFRGLEGLPALTPQAIAGQISLVQGWRMNYAMRHADDPNLKDDLVQYDNMIDRLRTAYTGSLSAVQQVKNAQITGAQQAKIANPTPTASNTAAPPHLDSLGVEITPVAGVRQSQFKADADQLAKTEQTYDQFSDVLADIKAGKDITGAQSVVSLFNAIGLSATPLKGMGFRINNNTVAEHANARGLGQSLYQKFLGLKNGDVVTPRQIEDYANVAVSSRENAYITKINQVRNAGVDPGFLLPNGNGKALDPSTAKIFFAAANSNPANARAAAKQHGWKF